jgi:hypothetical protein
MAFKVSASKSPNKTTRRYTPRSQADMENTRGGRQDDVAALAARGLTHTRGFLSCDERLQIRERRYDVHHGVRIVDFSRWARFGGVYPRFTRFP